MAAPDRFDQRSIIPFLRQPPAVEQALKNFLNDVRQHIQDVIGNTTIPGQVSGFTANADGHTIRLNWNSVFNAHSYQILRGSTRVLTDATVIAIVTAPQRIFHDPFSTAAVRYYWIKALSPLYEPGPVSAMLTITPTLQTYTPTNVTTDRSYDADTVVVAELADIVGTLIADLQAKGLIQ